MVPVTFPLSPSPLSQLTSHGQPESWSKLVKPGAVSPAPVPVGVATGMPSTLPSDPPWGSHGGLTWSPPLPLCPPSTWGPDDVHVTSLPQLPTLPWPCFLVGEGKRLEDPLGAPNPTSAPPGWLAGCLLTPSVRVPRGRPPLPLTFPTLPQLSPSSAHQVSFCAT